MLALLLLGCGPNLAPGQWGPLRYFGDLRGDVPMRLIPPLTDREGNIYVLYGAEDRTDTEVFVGPFDGGWSGGCQAHRGLGGLHGWVGHSERTAWFWAGDALVEVDGRTGACREVLTEDPLSGTELFFIGVAPFIDETPSQRLATAIVDAGAGNPGLVYIDLDGRLPLAPVALPFSDPENLEVLGTGTWADERQTIFIVRADGAEHVLVVNSLGAGSFFTLSLNWPATATRIEGIVQFSAAGLGAGLLDDGSVLFITQGGTSVVPVSGFEPVGLQRWNGELWLTGIQDGTPVAAWINANGIGNPAPWQSAVSAAANLQNTMLVRDERAAPALFTEWANPASAFAQPLLTHHPLDGYTADSTGWLLAGPGYDTVLERVNAVAFAPVGVRFP